MKQRKAFNYCVVLVLLFLVAVAFQSFAAGRQEAGGEKVVLRFPHWYFGHGGTFQEWIEGACEDFSKAHPNVTIDGYSVAYEEFWNKLDTAIAGGNPPDILALDNVTLGKYIDNGHALPLNDLVDMDAINRDFNSIQTKGVVSAAKDGKTYLIAHSFGWYMPMYRPSVFKKAGIASYARTPDEFVEMTKKITASGTKGYAAMTMPGNSKEGLIDLSIWTIGQGGHYGKGNTPTLNSREVVEAITYLKKLFDADVIPRETEKGTYRKMFGTGNLGTLIDGPWMYGLSLGWDPTVKGDYKVAPLPFRTQHPAGFYEGQSVSSKTKHPKEAAALVYYLASAEQQKRFVRLVTFGSCRKDIFQDQAFLNEILGVNPWFKGFLDRMNDVVLYNPEGMDVGKIPELIKIWYTGFERVLYEDEDPQTAMDDAQKEALRLF